MKKLFTLIVILTGGFISLDAIAQPCSDLFISEYIEGSSFNKAIEIFNPTTGTVQLDGYELLLYSNGAPADSPSFKFNLHGELSSLGVYVIANSSADTSVLSFADTTNLVCNWNGNDAVALVNNIVGDTLDVIGVIGEDPGTEWTVGAGSTKDHSLVRMISVQEGTTDWSLSSTQWDVYAQNDFSNLGFHNMTACAVTIPELTISSDSASVPESVGSFNLKINILNPNSNATSADVNVTGGTATLGTDYNFTNQTVTFPANSSTPLLLPVSVVNDAIVEPDETMEFSLQNPTNGATIAAGIANVKIIDDDGLGIEENLSSPLINLFPNPTDNILYIHSVLPVDEISVENIFGEEIVQLFPANKQAPVLHLNKFPEGIYFLKIYSGENVTMKEVVKR